MKAIKCTAVLCVICVIAAAFGGCTAGYGLKDHIIGGFNRALSSLSRFALTSDSQLQGSRTPGEDSFTGTYHADYSGFSGEEYLFGGTLLERHGGSDICVTYELQITDGSADIYVADSEEKILLTDKSESGTYIWKISSGDHYISVRGDNLSGSLTFICEQ